jgi:hypothetical protein
MTDKYGSIFVIQGKENYTGESDYEQSLDTVGSFHVGEPLIRLFSGDLASTEMESAESKSSEENDLFSLSNMDQSQVFWKQDVLDSGWEVDRRESSSFINLGSLALHDESRLKSSRRVIYGLSVTGSLYGFLEIPDRLFEQLQVFEDVLDNDLDFCATFGRGRKTFRKSLNFVDLIYLEHFLELSDSAKKKIASEWNRNWKKRHGKNASEGWVDVVGLERAIDILRQSA